MPHSPARLGFLCNAWANFFVLFLLLFFFVLIITISYEPTLLSCEGIGGSTEDGQSFIVLWLAPNSEAETTHHNSHNSLDLKKSG